MLCCTEEDAKRNEQPRSSPPQKTSSRASAMDKQRKLKRTTTTADAVQMRNCGSSTEIRPARPPPAMLPILSPAAAARCAVASLPARRHEALGWPIGGKGRTHRRDGQRGPSTAAATLPPHPLPTPPAAYRTEMHRTSLRAGRRVGWQPHRGRHRSLPRQYRAAL